MRCTRGDKLRKFLGHSDIQTKMRYLYVDDDEVNIDAQETLDMLMDDSRPENQVVDIQDARVK